MVGVELVLAVVATADLAFKYGKLLVDTYATFKGAEAEIDERVLSVEIYWDRTRQQVEFLLKIWDTLDESHQSIQSRTLRVLVSKLENAIAQIERMQKKKEKDGELDNQKVGLRRWKYVLIKTCMDNAIQDFEAWQKMWDPSWFLIMKVASPLIDQELAKDDSKSEAGSMATAKGVRDSLKEEPQIPTKIFLPENGLASAIRQNIPFSTAQTMRRTPTSRLSILDSVACDPEANISILTKDVRDLARKLSRADALTFGLLECRGVVRVLDADKKKITSFDFVFKIPDGMESPKSLRSILISADSSLSLLVGASKSHDNLLHRLATFTPTASYIRTSVLRRLSFSRTRHLP